MTYPISPQSSLGPETPLSLQQQLEELRAQIHRLENTLQQQEITIRSLRARIPNSAVISPNFISRAFAIWGHTFVAGVIISIVISCALFVLNALFGGLPDLLNY